LYGGYTRGLEESGVAPENSANRGEVQPVSLTEQVDAGLRYRLGTQLTFIAGVFEVNKPYFDRNATNIFTDVGKLSHRGVELSLSGKLAPGLTVVAGAMLLRARIEPNAAVVSFIGAVPAGRPNRTIRLNAQYGPPAWRGFSVDAQVNQDGPAYANRVNTLQLDPNTTLDLGTRYVFKMFGQSASLRLRVLNVTNAYGWTVSSSGWYAATPQRRFTAQLVGDF
jgi:iron complex outermembrane recepter protein